MGDALSKIENFLFDILGLALPGLIFLTTLFLPLLILDTTKIPVDAVDKSFILSELSTFSKIVKAYWKSDSKIIIAFWFVLAYLLGHLVKVFAIIKYDILTAVFDRSVNRLTQYLWKKIGGATIYTYSWLTKGKALQNTFAYKWSNEIFGPIKSLLFKIFVFKPAEYFKENDSLKSECVSLINERLTTNYPDKWYSVYKFSTVISNQEGVKSLASNFLAKYNLYRSLAFIFLIAAMYYYLFFKVAATYITPDFRKIGSLVSIIFFLLWFTFHYKYKRYWTLCGNETLVSLYYFLNKKKVNAN